MGDEGRIEAYKGQKSYKIHLAGGDTVPGYLVDVLHAFEREWPGSSLRQARPGIVAAILRAQKAKRRAKNRESLLVWEDDKGQRHVIGKAVYDETTDETTMQINTPRFFLLVAENMSSSETDDTETTNT